jgi:hypothetical protein
MDFRSIPFVARSKPAGGGGGGSLSKVQEPAKVETWGNSVSRSLSAVGSGNGLIVTVRGETGAGAPTISDSAGGSWSAAVHSYGETTNNSMTYYFIRNNVTSGLTSVTATFASGNECAIGVVEATGAALALDTTLGSTVGSASDPWNMAFTSTAANTILVGMAAFSNSTTVTDVAPLDSDATSEYFAYFRGLFPTAGSNTGQLDLSDVRTGAYSGIVVKGS